MDGTQEGVQLTSRCSGPAFGRPLIGKALDNINMSDGNFLINLGDLSKPATVLIEKVSDAVGGVFRPAQIKRVAKAEAEANKIRALANIEISEIEHRAMQRLVHEEGKKQENIEKITADATRQLNEDAKPENIDNDWIANFFDKCRLVSDGEMQSLWSRLLASEANVPGTYSKRTVNLISSLDKADAQLFTNLLTFGWFLGDVVPLVYDVQDEIYNKQGINFNSLNHLDSLGLITFNSISVFQRLELPKIITVGYYREPFTIELQAEKKNNLNLGLVLLTAAGQQLAPVCGSAPSNEFKQYVLEKWKSLGYVLSCPLPNKAN